MDDLLLFGLLGSYALLLVLDAATPARRFPSLPRWRLKGLVFLALYLAISTVTPLLWDGWFGEHRLIDATGLGLWGGAAVALLAQELGMYAYHRLMHKSDFLFRFFHQVHHSAERVDVYGAFYFSPLDMVGFTVATSAGLVLVVGVSGESAALATAFATFLAAFQHANLRTPRWLGYFIVRPEQHALHHERGVHAYNYADLPVIDMIFGTYRNPATWDAEAGFWDGASRELPRMLAGRDVSRPTEPARVLRAA